MPEGKKGVLVVGGGISGLTAAVEVAEVGYPVYLVERSPYLGGRVAQNSRYFPKLCPPYCGLEINFRRIRTNPRIRCYTLAQVEEVSGEVGGYEVRIRVSPRYVNANCTACGKCAEVCPVDRPNPFNYGMDTTKAIYLPHDMAFPMRYVIDPETCRGAECAKCVEACPYHAVDLQMEEEVQVLEVGAIILATGWSPFDATEIPYYGFGHHSDIITNTMMERLASANGPTEGKILRPSDGKPVKRVAFVQCAGSRDENHLPYCSGVCCLASLKQALYVREQEPESEVTVFYIDIRALGRLEDFFTRVKEDDGIRLVKGKVAEIQEDPTTQDLVLRVEDVDRGESLEYGADLVVLATGMVPSTALDGLPLEIRKDGYGFALEENGSCGIFPVGCVKRPVDVARSVKDATGAALKAIQFLVRR